MRSFAWELLIGGAHCVAGSSVYMAYTLLGLTNSRCERVSACLQTRARK